MVKIQEINSKTIISKSNLPGSDFSINPYIGCMHSCIYCYARFMKRFSGHIDEWGSFVDVKINAGQLISERDYRIKGKIVFFSSVTDPYQPIETKYQLMPKILEKILPLEPKISIQTKSHIVLRDISIIKRFLDCEVGFTIITLDDNVRKEIEPFASTIQERIQGLKELKKNNIKTYVFIGPILPTITNWREIIYETSEFVDYYMFENLNISGAIWHSIKCWLNNKHFSVLQKYEDIYFSQNSFWENIENEIKAFCGSHGVKYKIYFHHNRKN